MAPRRRSSEPAPGFCPAALRRARAACGLSLDGLGQRTQLSRAALVAYEQGRARPGIDVLQALAQALAIDPLDLLGDDLATATLAQLRARAGLTKTAMATRMGLARCMWAHVEAGRRTLQPAQGARAAALLQIDQTALHAAHRRGLRVAPPPGRRAAATQARHFALTHHLPAGVAAEPASARWVRQRARRYAAAAGVELHTVTTSPDRYTALTGIPVGPDDWGKASWAAGRHIVYIQPHCGGGTKGGVELVVAHEISHLRWPSYGHRTVFFDRVQRLVDTAGHHPQPEAGASR